MEKRIPYLTPILKNVPGEYNLFVFVQNNPINSIDQFSLIGCNGRWRVAGTDGPMNMACICYWLCVPCHGSALWGNYRSLPSTWGKWINTGYGGAESGDSCFCNKKPGPEKKCDECS
jgi:hypothetical protein